MDSNVENAIQNGYELKVGEALSQGIDIFKKNAGGFIGYAFVSGIILVFVGVLPIISIANIFLSPILLAGFYIVAHKVANNETTTFSDFFKGFDKFGEFALLGVLQLVIYIAIFVPFIIVLFATIGVGALSGQSGQALASALLGIGSFAAIILLLTLAAFIYVSVSLMTASPLILFCNYNAVDAMKTSFKLVGKQWGSWFLLALLGAVLNFFGTLVLFIGLLISFPIVYCMNYSAFRNVARLGKHDELKKQIDEIGTALPSNE
jgi:hypothetical protein